MKKSPGTSSFKMLFSTPLIQGKILKRYKRFFTDLELPSGEVITAHTPNTGSMRTCLSQGMKALVSEKRTPERKLPYTLEMTHNGQTYIGVNTSLTNKLAFEAIQNGLVTELAAYGKITPEYKIGASRIDFLLESEGLGACLVEVKNVTLREENGVAYFPDSVSTRGQKHLKELIEFRQKGQAAAMLFIIQREDIEIFSPAIHIDEEYARLLKLAQQAGVMVLPYRCSLAPEGIHVQKKIRYQETFF